MLSPEDKREIMIAAERRLAARVAADVVDKPELALWMILIPVFFVFYYFQFKRYKNGLRAFSRNFILTRERTLNAVYEGIEEQREPRLKPLLDVSDMVEETKPKYLEWITELANYYRVLFAASGTDYSSLVRAAYKNRTNYLLVLDRLGRVEQEFNKAIAPHLGDKEGTTAIITAMERSVKKNRREVAEEIFNRSKRTT